MRYLPCSLLLLCFASLLALGLGLVNPLYNQCFDTDTRLAHCPLVTISTMRHATTQYLNLEENVVRVSTATPPTVWRLEPGFEINEATTCVYPMEGDDDHNKFYIRSAATNVLLNSTVCEVKKYTGWNGIPPMGGDTIKCGYWLTYTNNNAAINTLPFWALAMTASRRHYEWNITLATPSCDSTTYQCTHEMCNV